MATTPQLRKQTAGNAGQFDFVRHSEADVTLDPAAAPELSDDELLRRDREVGELRQVEGETYQEYPADTLRVVYAEEMNRIRGWRDSTEPRFTAVGFRPHWERKEIELAYLTGASDELNLS